MQQWCCIKLINISKPPFLATQFLPWCKHFNSSVCIHSTINMRTCVPEAGTKGWDKSIHPTITCPYPWYQFLAHKSLYAMKSTLHWRHNDHDGVSNHQPHGCLLNRLFRRRSKKTLKLCVTGLCVGNSPGPVNSPHKGPVTRKMLPFDDVIMSNLHRIFNVFWKFKQFGWLDDINLTNDFVDAIMLNNLSWSSLAYTHWVSISAKANTSKICICVNVVDHYICLY